MILDQRRPETLRERPDPLPEITKRLVDMLLLALAPRSTNWRTPASRAAATTGSGASSPSGSSSGAAAPASADVEPRHRTAG